MSTIVTFICFLMAYTKVCNHPQPRATYHNHLQPSTTTRNHPRLSTATYNDLQPSTTIHNHPQLPTTTHNHLKPPKSCPKKPKINSCYCTLDVNTERDVDFDIDMKHWYI